MNFQKSIFTTTEGFVGKERRKGTQMNFQKCFFLAVPDFTFHSRNQVHKGINVQKSHYGFYKY